MAKYNLLDSTIYLSTEEILVIGDLHCGFEKELRRSFGEVYLRQEEKNLNLMKKILKKTNRIKKVVFLGDITHSFKYKQEEVKEFEKIISLLKSENEKTKIIVTKGNHDLFLKEKMFENKIKMVDCFFEKDSLFVHGDKKSLEKAKEKIKKAKKIFIGHFHPAIELTDGIKKEMYKCFLIGKYKGKEYFLLPSFFPIIEGRDIRKNTEIDRDLIDKLNVFVIDNKFNFYDFGKLEKLRSK